MYGSRGRVAVAGTGSRYYSPVSASPARAGVSLIRHRQCSVYSCTVYALGLARWPGRWGGRRPWPMANWPCCGCCMLAAVTNSIETGISIRYSPVCVQRSQILGVPRAKKLPCADRTARPNWAYFYSRTTAPSRERCAPHAHLCTQPWAQQPPRRGSFRICLGQHCTSLQSRPVPACGSCGSCSSPP